MLEWFYAIVGNGLVVYLCYKFYMFGINEGFQKLFKRKQKKGVNSGQKFG